MSCDAALQTALKPLGLPVYPNKYTGSALEYLVTNFTALGAAHGGDFAQAARYLVQVHYYSRDKLNPNDMIERICKALAAEDFSSPDIIPGHSDHGLHWVIECEYCDGGVDYGPC